MGVVFLSCAVICPSWLPRAAAHKHCILVGVLLIAGASFLSYHGRQSSTSCLHFPRSLQPASQPAHLPCALVRLQMWMSKAEYREYGAGLVHKKAP